MAKITAENITDEQLSALWRESCGTGISHHDANPDLMHIATVAQNSFGDHSADEQYAARAQCALILNARKEQKP